MALHNYESAQGVLPPAGWSSNELGWPVLVLPYLEQNVLYAQFNFRAGDYTDVPH